MRRGALPFVLTLALASVAGAEPSLASTDAGGAVAAAQRPAPGVERQLGEGAQGPRAAATGLRGAEAAPTLELPKTDADLTADDELNLGWTLVKTFVVLGIVIALAYLTLNVGLRKLLGIRPAIGGKGIVTVLERVALDQKRALFVVEAAGEVLLIGGADANLALISKLDAAAVEKLRAAPASPPLQLSPFLQKLLRRKDAPPPPAS